MALIKCPECGREISDKAYSCPQCGYPISQDKTPISYTVILEDCGNQKVQVIKKIREINKLDLLPAKIIADNTPTIFSYNISLENATKIKNQLESVGAIVSVRGFNDNDIIEQQINSQKVRCPRCGSDQITTGQRGYSFWTGFLGSNKTVNRCAKCGHSWNP